MYALRVEDDRGEIRRVVVDKDVYSIGRSDDNDLVLTDVNVSRHHARLEVRSIGVVLVDAGASYGIRMNGVQAPSETLLQGGDSFVLGDYRFELVPAEGDVDISPSSTIRMTKVHEEQPAGGAASVESMAVPGMDGLPGVHYTVAISEDESLKILLEMRRNMVAGVSGSSAGDDSGDESEDPAVSDEQRRSRVVRTIMIIVLLATTAILGWLVYSMFIASDPYLGSLSVRAAGLLAAAVGGPDVIPPV